MAEVNSVIKELHLRRKKRLKLMEMKAETQLVSESTKITEDVQVIAKASKEESVPSLPTVTEVNVAPPSQDFAAEIVLSILGYLPLKDLVTASGVCKQWRRLSKTPSLWRTVSFEGTVVDNLPRSLWKKLDRLGTTCLDFHACADPSLAPRKVIPFICKRKNLVALYFGVIEKQDLCSIVAGMPQLNILHASCILPSIPSRELEILFDVGCFVTLESLMELKISSVYTLSLPTIALSGGTEHLEQLQRMKKLVLTNFKYLDTGSVQFLGALHNLEHLELGSCSQFTTLTYAGLHGLKNLKSLSLTEAHCSCHNETCVCIGLLLQQLKRLTRLTLLLCVVPKTISSILSMMPCLKDLELWPYVEDILGSSTECHRSSDIADVYAGLVTRLGHLQSIKLGILDECVMSTTSWDSSDEDSNGHYSNDSDHNDSGREDCSQNEEELGTVHNRENSSKYSEMSQSIQMMENAQKHIESEEVCCQGNTEKQSLCPLLAPCHNEQNESDARLAPEVDDLPPVEAKTDDGKSTHAELKMEIPEEKFSSSIDCAHGLTVFELVRKTMLRHPMPATKVTLSEVARYECDKDGLGMFYISREEESFPVLDLG